MDMNFADLFNEGFIRKDLDGANLNVYPCCSLCHGPKRFPELKN